MGPDAEVEERCEACRLEPEDGLKLTVENAFRVEIDIVSRGLLHEHDAAGEHDREHDTHRGAVLDPAEASNELNQDGS